MLYAVNRWLLKPWLPISLLQNWFDDFLLIPCALPPLLWLQTRLKLRAGNQPRWSEIAFHLAIWAVLFEWAGPHLIRYATGDVWDVAAYALGGLAAGWWWNRPGLSCLES